MTDVHTMSALCEPRRVIAHFSDAEMFENAVETLESNGFRRDSINMVASHDAVIGKPAHRFEAMASRDDTAVFRQPIYLDRQEVEVDEKLARSLPACLGGAGACVAVVSTGGTLALAVAVSAAAAAAGAGLGTLLGRVIGRNRTEYLAKQLAMGDLLVVVQVEQEPDETRALDLLTGSGGQKIHAQSISRDRDDVDAASGNFDLGMCREWGQSCH